MHAAHRQCGSPNILHSLAVCSSWDAELLWGLATEAVDSCIATALQAAADAAGPSGLKLTCVDCEASGGTPYPALLRQLPSVCGAHLTCLKPGRVIGIDISAVIVQLTALRELKVDGYDRDDKDRSLKLQRYLTALAGLRHLTFLDTKLANSQLPSLAQLPTLGLRRLHLSANRYLDGSPSMGDRGKLLQLSHLTALTGLRLTCKLHEGDELPTSVQLLELQELDEIVPMLQLQQLSRLQLSHLKLNKQQLRQLGSSLGRLQHVGLHCNHTLAISDAANGAAAWSSIQLKDLEVVPPNYWDRIPMIDEALIYYGLRRCSVLTRLTLGRDRKYQRHYWDNGFVGPAPSRLAAALQQLTALQDLTLHISSWANVQDGFAALAHSISCLTALHALHLDCMPVDGANGACLSALHGLTRMEVQHVAYDAEGLSLLGLSSSGQEAAGQPISRFEAHSGDWQRFVAALGCLSGLQFFSLIGCNGLATEDALEQQWQSLRKLTRLSMWGCGLADKCVDCLAKHSTGLVSLNLRYWRGLDDRKGMWPFVDDDDDDDDDDNPPLPAGDPGCFTDAGMFAVARQLQCLTCLSIQGASITDAGLQALSALHCLTIIGLSSCLDVTEGATEALEAQWEHRWLRSSPAGIDWQE